MLLPDKWQLNAIRLLVALLSPVLFSGCNSGAKPDPQTDYQQVRLTMVRGDLVEAGHQAKEGFDKFSPLSVEWAWRFRILEAEILVYRKMNQEALSILNSPLPESLSSGDEAIREDMVEALALERLGRNQEADEHLRKAEQLCQLEHSKLDGQLGQFEGVIAVDRGHFAEADVLFRRCLRSARTQKDEVLEAIALLNLGLSALKQEHYDSAISWSTDAYQAARILEAHFAEEKILGNLGLAYYRMGDTEKSAFYFRQAADEARELQAKNDLVKWDIALGDASEKMNQTSAAEVYYGQARALAEKSEDTGDLVDVLTALAATSLANGKWDEAIYYSQLAISLCQSHGDHMRELDVLLIEGKIAAHQNDATRAQQLFREIAADQQSNMALKWEAQESLAKLYEDEHRTADAERQYEIALATFQNARASLQDEELRLPFLSNAAHLQDDYVHFLVSQRKSVKALQVADYSRAQTLAEGAGVGAQCSCFTAFRDEESTEAGRRTRCHNPVLLARTAIFLLVGSIAESRSFIAASINRVYQYFSPQLSQRTSWAKGCARSSQPERARPV